MISSDRWQLLQNFILSHYFTLSTHPHTNIRAGWFSLLLIWRNTISLIRTGILCLELNTFSWMSTGLLKHGPGFSFYFPQWTVKCTFNRWCLHDMLSWQNKSNSLLNKPAWFYLSKWEKKKRTHLSNLQLYNNSITIYCLYWFRDTRDFSSHMYILYILVSLKPLPPSILEFT